MSLDNHLEDLWSRKNWNFTMGTTTISVRGGVGYIGAATL